MSRHEAPEVGAAILRMMNGLIRRAADGDTEAIEALYVIEGMAPHATNAALTLAHHDGDQGSTGYSYSFLAGVTDTSRAAVQQRIGRAPMARALTDCGHLACLGMRRCRRQYRGVGSVLVGCSDCGERGVQTGHMECAYPQDRP